MYYDINDTITHERVFNNGDVTNYVKVDIYKLVLDVESGKYNEQVLDDHEKNLLIISPNRLVIPPKKSVEVRVIAKPTETLAKYRVRFSPVNSKDYPDLFDSEKIDTEASDSIKTDLEVLISLGTIFYVNPESKKYDTRVFTSDDGVRILNNGNSTIGINKVRRCDENDDCISDSRFILEPKKEYFIKGKGGSYTIEDEVVSTYNF